MAFVLCLYAQITLLNDDLTVDCDSCFIVCWFVVLMNDLDA